MRPPAILVPLDGSESSLAALPVARVLSKVHRSSLCLAHVSQKDPANPDVVRRLERCAQELEDATLEVRAGEPAAQILRLAGEIKSQMIVLCKLPAAVSPRGLGGTAAAVLCETHEPPAVGRTPVPAH